MQFDDDVRQAALARIADAMRVPVDAVDPQRLDIRRDYWQEWNCEDGCCHTPAGEVVMLDSYISRDVEHTDDWFTPVSRAGLSVGVILRAGDADFEQFKQVATPVDDGSGEERIFGEPGLGTGADEDVW